jgi:hypothetical protein
MYSEVSTLLHLIYEPPGDMIRVLVTTVKNPNVCYPQNKSR